MPDPSPVDPVHGSCLCGGVRYAVTAPFRRANLCHCSRCRKHSGAAASAQGRVPREGFELIRGADLLTVWRPDDGGMAKVFCRTCGSSLFGGDWPDGPEVSVRLGALDDDPGLQVQFHSFAGAAAPWEVHADDGLPRFDGPPQPRPR
ncbi:hypothetical protein DSM112329_01011 [Paraconexibacter sp. AEG42_29]|uniref:CENP-V/GFA domain-containing protein n=1 Tax=Paraconexibacter sp. AEG42_29 TaxID=2997339 RepID=A0AAU7ARR0_9ACTN